MTDPRDPLWQTVDTLFQEVLEREPAEREAYLRQVCGGDEELRRRVEELVRAESESRAFLSRPIEAVTAVPWDEVLAPGMGTEDDEGAQGRETDRSGDQIGPYRLIEKIGRGGMATVYLAERADGLWEQRVALKLVRRGLDTDDVIRRFLAERQILSSLSHPNIGRLLDGGTTKEGLPYLVMEYVAGLRITDYCDAHRLALPDRLRLFCHAARAVQHAHRSLVVHRDLKPSNILVTEEGRVKLLDFGIAKILDPAEDAVVTRTGLRPLTPEYASPEQVAGDLITTASDVYQLGILLCELVSGKRPYEVDRTLSPSRLKEGLDRAEPKAPSSLVTDGAARARSSTPGRLGRELRGDLDTIVLRAIRKESGERYPSTEALVADLERHLDGLPIHARSPTPLYRGRKFLRRNPWALPAIVATILVLVGYGLTAFRYGSQLEEERNRARLEAERAEEVKSFLVDLFRTADPYAAAAEADRDITVREALALGAQRVREELDHRPDLQAPLLATIGDVYANLDLLGPARSFREEALALQEDLYGDDSAPFAHGLRVVGNLLAREGRPDTAQALLTRSLRLSQTVHGANDTAVAGVLVDLGDLAVRTGRFEEAERYLTDAVGRLEGQEPAPAAQLTRAYTVLLEVYPRNRQIDEALATAEEAVRLSRSAFGPDHPRTAMALVQAGDLHDWADRSPEAVPVYEEAIGILDRTVGPGHELTLEARNNLAVTLRHLGDLDGAERVHRELLAAWREKPGRWSRGLADALQNLAVVLLEKGTLSEAEMALQEARELYDGTLPEDHYVRAFPRLTLASLRIREKAFAAAEELAREATEILEATLPESSYVRAAAQCRLGEALAGQGRTVEARPLLEASVVTLAENPQPSVHYEVDCRRALVDVYRREGLEELALPHLEEIRRLEAAGAGAGA